MKAGRTIALAGVPVLALGAIFHLQGLAVVGPESSFMYSNPEWTSYGIQIAGIGASAIVAGIAVWMKSSRWPSK